LRTGVEKARGARTSRRMLTRAPSGRLQDRAVVRKDMKAAGGTTLERMAGRWLIEVCFRDLKQLFGMGDAQNGWGRGKKPRTKSAGADPLGVKGEHAVRRTAPLAGFIYAIVVITYIRMGRADNDVVQARKAAPWYTKKSAPSVIDMLAAHRSDLLARRLSPHPEDRSARAKILKLLPWDLMAAA